MVNRFTPSINQDFLLPERICGPKIQGFTPQIGIYLNYRPGCSVTSVFKFIERNTFNTGGANIRFQDGVLSSNNDYVVIYWTGLVETPTGVVVFRDGEILWNTLLSSTRYFQSCCFGTDGNVYIQGFNADNLKTQVSFHKFDGETGEHLLELLYPTDSGNSATNNAQWTCSPPFLNQITFTNSGAIQTTTGARKRVTVDHSFNIIAEFETVFIPRLGISVGILDAVWYTHEDNLQFPVQTFAPDSFSGGAIERTAIVTTDIHGNFISETDFGAIVNRNIFGHTYRRFNEFIAFVSWGFGTLWNNVTGELIYSSLDLGSMNAGEDVGLIGFLNADNDPYCDMDKELLYYEYESYYLGVDINVSGGPHVKVYPKNDPEVRSNYGALWKSIAGNPRLSIGDTLPGRDNIGISFLP